MNIENQIRILENQLRDNTAKLKQLQQNPTENQSNILEYNKRQLTIQEQLRDLRRQDYDSRNRVDISDDR